MSAPPSEQILTQIAEQRNIGVMDLPPLYNTIDPEELDAVIQSLDEGHVSFTYADCDVTVTSKEEISISVRALATQS